MSESEQLRSKSVRHPSIVICAFFLIGTFVLRFANAEIAIRACQVPQSKQEPAASVRFELYHNRIYVPVEVNGSSVPSMFIVDTGASMSSLDDQQAKALGIELRDNGEVKNAGNGEEPIHFSEAKNVRFRLGGIEILSKTVGVVPLRSWERFEGRAAAGVLGAELFKRYVVEVDYERTTLSLYEPSSYTAPDKAEIIPLRFLGASIPVVEATLEIPSPSLLKANLVIDMGTYSAIRLNRPYIEEHKLLAAVPGSVPYLGFGLEGDFRESLGRLRSLRLGTLRIENPLTSFSQSSSGKTTAKAYDGSIGGAVLRQFKVTIDYAHKNLILQSSGIQKKVDQADMSGVVLIASGAAFRVISVYRVFEKTPAAESGLCEGDVLLAIDNRSPAEFGLEVTRQLFSQEGKYNLRIKRGEQEIQLTLATRNLI